MISKKQIEEIRTYIQQAKNPVYFFDDDSDGLCSFLLLWHFAPKGRGIPVRGEINEHYTEKLHELNADLLVILDKPVLAQETVDMIGIPIVHIDHHPPLTIKAPNYHYYNPRVHDDADNRPTSYWAYQVTQQNLWIAMVGIISDWYIPEFVDEFKEKYPGLLPDKLTYPGQALFDAEFGTLARAFAFSLKGESSERRACLQILMKLESPAEILEQNTPRGKFIYRHFTKINRYYQKLREEALATKSRGKVLIFTYPSSEHSLTSLLSNELIYRHQDKVVIIGRVKDDEVIISIRSTKLKIPPLLEKAFEGLEGGGGGHDLACGAHIKTEDFSKFMRKFTQLVNKAKR